MTGREHNQSNIQLRKNRSRRRLVSRSGRPRLVVYRSNKYLYAALVQTTSGKTLAGVRNTKPEEAGKLIAKKGLKLGLKEVVFDRGPYSYHGRVKALAEAARQAGLDF